MIQLGLVIGSVRARLYIGTPLPAGMRDLFPSVLPWQSRNFQTVVQTTSLSRSVAERLTISLSVVSGSPVSCTFPPDQPRTLPGPGLSNASCPATLTEEECRRSMQDQHKGR